MAFEFYNNFGSCDSCDEKYIMINCLYVRGDKSNIYDEWDLCDKCLNLLKTKLNNLN